MTIKELLEKVTQCQAAEPRVRIILTQGNARQIVRQLEALEAMTGQEYETVVLGNTEPVGTGIAYCPMHMAAPALLAALKELARAMRDYEMEIDEPSPAKHKDMMERADKAIAAAEGREA